MTNPDQISKNSFLYPRSRYYGQFSPQHLAFNANLQEFSQKVSYIVALETGGKLSPEQAYEQMKCLWKQLKQNKKAMKLGADRSSETK